MRMDLNRIAFSCSFGGKPHLAKQWMAVLFHADCDVPGRKVAVPTRTNVRTCDLGRPQMGTFSMVPASWEGPRPSGFLSVRLLDGAGPSCVSNRTGCPGCATQFHTPQRQRA